MSLLQYFHPSPRRLKQLALAALGVSISLGVGLRPGRAQYPGHSERKVKAGPVLRSIAVLEWTGQPGKPSASRLIPVTVFHDSAYEDGGLYLARPEPLSLDSGTEYQLQDAGLPQGNFAVATAGQLGGAWFGYGAWKPLAAPALIHKLQPSKIDPEVVDGGSDRRPHFRKSAPADGTAGSGVPGAATPPEDPDRPTLRKRPASNPDASATANPATAEATGSLETATAGGDPDRPRLSHGVPRDQPKGPEHLEGMPPGIQQMAAVSDAEDRKEHSFRYSWSNPEDATRLQAALTTIAQQAVAKAALPAKATATAGIAHPSVSPVARPRAAQTPAQRAAARRRAAAAKTSGTVLLTDVQFHAFELTYSGGATLVLTARTAGDDLKASYVTVIAQPDIYGTPQVLFTQVAHASSLDATPRMRLVDAVDAAADNRGDLLFELRGATSRQFALYRVASGRVDQLMATGQLPVGIAAANQAVN